MKKLVFTYLALTFGFNSIALASRNSFDQVSVNADLKVQYFEYTKNMIIPDMLTADQMDMGFGAQSVPVIKGGYRIQAEVQMCQPVVAEDFKVIVREKNGANVISVKIDKVLEACDGPATTQVVELEYTGDIDYNLPLVQVNTL